MKAYNRSQDKLEALKEEFGLIPCETIAQAVDGADVVFVMVGYPKDVEEVFLGKGGIFESAKEGASAHRYDHFLSLPGPAPL